MTCIAWDGKTLAADRGGFNGRIVIGVGRKAHRIVDRGEVLLLACTGSTALCDEIVRWMRGGPEPAWREYPADDVASNTLAIAVRGGQAFLLQTMPPRWIEVRDPVAALGAGRDFVMGALAAGATAEQAIKLAHHWTDCAARGVDSVRA